MADFETLLARATDKNAPTLHGAIFKGVDKHGQEIYSKIAGHASLPSPSNPDPPVLQEDAVFKAASSTKLFASVALLQCVDRGLIGLDDPVSSVLPELAHPQIITGISPDTGAAQYTPATQPITPRHLLTHTSGLGYWFLHPLLMKWATTTPEGKKSRESLLVHERHAIPLLFEPGGQGQGQEESPGGWMYGVGLDWAGCLVRRLHGNMSLEDYMIENIWKPLGLQAPYPTFCISKKGEDGDEYRRRLMGGAERYTFWQGDNAQDQDGGHGLCLTTRDFVAVLADLVADEPKLLSREMVQEMFTPQLAPGSAAQKSLAGLRVVCDTVAGPDVDADAVNHGLGGLLVTKESPVSGQPAGTLAWGGAANTIWFACRDKGVAGFMTTQVHPFGDQQVHELVEAWRKEFWATPQLG
ncbi:penicillin binding protein [Microdochium trichocladiopsis]|uniref:Penicillin binding protein n=1 Tax=Microdochium trichocladiopsis TaxID=1682393 RepID=A0A9P8XWE0_9PEZI|nr:penicillin binding protein [Microdochium trichocladiopsis]KAH7021410.1 penicillin binding protein [Microdochium trichocladiopsis]